MQPRPHTRQAELFGPKPQRFSIIFLLEETSILRIIILRDGGNSNSMGHESLFFNWKKIPYFESLLFEVEETPILRIIILRGGRNFNSANHYSLWCREFQFYESLLFEIGETPILRVVTFSRLRKLPFYKSLFFELEETLILRAIIFRDGGNPHSTSHYSSTRRNSYLRVITLQLEAIHILRVVTLRRDETSLLRVITVEVKETPILRVNIRDEEIYNLRGTVYDRYFVEEPPRPHSRSYPMSTRQLDGAQTRNIAAVGDVRRWSRPGQTVPHQYYFSAGTFPFYESLLFEVKENPILRVIFRGVINSQFTNHYFSSEENFLLRVITLRCVGNYHSTNDLCESRTRTPSRRSILFWFTRRGEAVIDRCLKDFPPTCNTDQ